MKAELWAEPPLLFLNADACGKWAHTLTAGAIYLRTEQKNRSPEAAGFWARAAQALSNRKNVVLYFDAPQKIAPPHPASPAHFSA
jgi:hypothetical protein